MIPLNGLIQSLLNKLLPDFQMTDRASAFGVDTPEIQCQNALQWTGFEITLLDDKAPTSFKERGREGGSSWAILFFSLVY